MSEIIVSFSVEINGRLTNNGEKPKVLTWEHRYHAEDDNRKYGEEIEKATASAIAKVLKNLQAYKQS